jgi:prepilin-type N-terminal cleavage/methylation domain-containing protein
MRPESRWCIGTRRRRAGLSLIELMVTIALLAIGLVGVSSMFIVGYKTQLHAHFASVATDIASKKVEEMKSAGFNGINTMLFPPTFTAAELPSGSGTTTFAPYPDADSPNQYLVQVVVTWGGGNGVAGRVRLSTVISNHS